MGKSAKPAPPAVGVDGAQCNRELEPTAASPGQEHLRSGRRTPAAPARPGPPCHHAASKAVTCRSTAATRPAGTLQRLQEPK